MLPANTEPMPGERRWVTNIRAITREECGRNRVILWDYPYFRVYEDRTAMDRVLDEYRPSSRIQSWYRYHVEWEHNGVPDVMGFHTIDRALKTFTALVQRRVLRVDLIDRGYPAPAIVSWWHIDSPQVSEYHLAVEPDYFERSQSKTLSDACHSSIPQGGVFVRSFL